MSRQHVSLIAKELGLRLEQVAATVALLDDDATVPFIARYRKEATGGLDEVAIERIRDCIAQLRELDKRREAILKSLTERDLLTPELEAKVNHAATLTALEDIYLPYRPKRRTRATIAREKGLERLAELLFAQDDIDPLQQAEAFVNPEKEVASVEEALAGARDIVAEWVNEDADARARLRLLIACEGQVESRSVSGKEKEAAKYSDYFEWRESVTRIASHQYLALQRAESQGLLRVAVAPSEESALRVLDSIFVIGDSAVSDQVREAVRDSYKRLLGPAMETEAKAVLRERSEAVAIRVFADNLRQLLMAPPLGRKAVMAIDPGFRTGCKTVCLDKQGRLQHHVTIQPHASVGEREDATREIKALCEKYQVSVIAIGNGTASRETEEFVRAIDLPEHVSIEIVNEAGASVYSASEVAREEFPDHDITVRGAVSIGRRLQDPLAELVKIDPKAIGVGQYQHDVDQAALKRSLDDTVMSCVNAVGVDLNTASKELLTYVSGLGPSLAGNIVAYRNESGPFKSRRQLRKVPRLGPKAFEQAAGFLRIPDASDPLDNTGVHPESYPLVERMASDLGCTVSQLVQSEERREQVALPKYVGGAVGLPTLEDIMLELAKPGRDPRPPYEPFKFDPSVRTVADLREGMVLPGIITNVVEFGAFVDIGVHQDGLVHKSELADTFVRDPREVVRLQQRVRVKVMSVDEERGRVSLSMRGVG